MTLKICSSIDTVVALSPLMVDGVHGDMLTSITVLPQGFLDKISELEVKQFIGSSTH